MLTILKKIAYKRKIQNKLSLHRFYLIDKLMNGYILESHPSQVRFLDVGCSIGKDFIKFLSGREDIQIFGLDIAEMNIQQENFTMVVSDACEIPFPDNYFNFTVSIGVLEHIIPIDKLVRVVNEINRVSQSFSVIVPSNGTIIEPHVSRFFWHIQDRNKKIHHRKLIYLSDDAWMSFEGFRGAKSYRYWHIPFLVNNLIIYKNQN